MDLKRHLSIVVGVFFNISYFFANLVQEFGIIYLGFN